MSECSNIVGNFVTICMAVESVEKVTKVKGVGLAFISHIYILICMNWIELLDCLKLCKIALYKKSNFLLLFSLWSLKQLVHSLIPSVFPFLFTTFLYILSLVWGEKYLNSQPRYLIQALMRDENGWEMCMCVCVCEAAEKERPGMVR